MRKILFTLFIGTLSWSCQSSDKIKEGTRRNGNMLETISSDIALLEKNLDFSLYKPSSVVYKKVEVDSTGTSGNGDNIYIEALLIFDEVTFHKLTEQYKSTELSPVNFTREEFNFDWLDETTRKELTATDPAYHGHPDFFFGTGHNGHLWLLNKKILLSKKME